ncbi:hypothetical protein E4T44_15284, partial [Aureobasidium sp. EXF-8845]
LTANLTWAKSRVTFVSNDYIHFEQHRTKDSLRSPSSVGVMDKSAAANAFGILGAVLWSLQLLPQMWKNFHRHSTEELSPHFFLAWSIAGIPLGIYNIVDDYNIALQIQPNILIILSLITWSQCKHYGDKWTLKKTILASTFIALIFGGIEAGLVFALRLGRDRGTHWPSTLMAILAAALLAG